MDGSGFKAIAFLQLYLCGMVAGVVGFVEGHATFLTILASAVLLSASILTALWYHEWRAHMHTGSPLESFAPGAGRYAVIGAWLTLLIDVAVGTPLLLYIGYCAVIACLLWQARTLESRESQPALGLEA